MGYYQDVIEQPPYGLEIALRKIMDFHVGLENAITRPELLVSLKHHGFDLHDDRIPRAIFSTWRKTGEWKDLVVSTNSAPGGYFRPRTCEEAERYMRVELIDKSANLEAQITGIKQAMKKEWGYLSPTMQTRMGI